MVVDSSFLRGVSVGFPSNEGTVRRQKIPLDDEDWARLLRIARRFDQDRLHPTPGQVASALLRISLANLDLAERHG